MSPSNAAAILLSKQWFIAIGVIDYPIIQFVEVLFRNTAVAFSPVEWKIARPGVFPIQYPAVLGLSYGGIVEVVDQAVTRVKKGILRFHAKWERSKKALVYGRSSSLGAFAIEYFVQADYIVISTSTSSNHGLVSGYGPTLVDRTKQTEVVISESKPHGLYNLAFDAISTPDAPALNAAVLGVQSNDIVLYSVGPPPPANVVIPNNVHRVKKPWPEALAAADPVYDEWIFTKYIIEAVAAGTLKSVPTELVKGALFAFDTALKKVEKGVRGWKWILCPWEDADKDGL